MSFRRFGEWPLSEAGGVMDLVKFLLLMQPSGGIGSVNGNAWDYREEFITAIDPMDSPHTMEPGPGTRTLINTDGTAVISIAADALTVKVGATTARVISHKTVGVTRTAGYAFFWKVNKAASYPIYAYLVLTKTPSVATLLDNTDEGGVAVYNTGLEFDEGQGASIPHDLVAGSVMYVAAIFKPTAGIMFVARGGRYTRPTLVWASTMLNTTPIYPAISIFNNSNSINDKVYYERGVQLPAPFTGSMATIDLTNPASGTITACEADAMITVLATMPASPSANQVALRVNYRRTGANDYFTYYYKRDATNTAWEAHFESVVGGVPSDLKTAVTGIAACFGLRIHTNGIYHNHWRNVTATGSRKGVGTEASSVTAQTQTGLELIYDAATTVTRLTADPINSAALDSLGAYWDFLA